MNVITTIDSLRCRVLQEGEADLPTLVVVLCHGFGAPGDDLAPIGREILSLRPEIESKVRFVFPEGPLSMEELGLPNARAWWVVDFDRLGALQQAGLEGSRLWREYIPEGLPKARRLLMGLVDSLARQLRLPVSRILLGGFSQGAMLATDVALRLEESPAGLAILSGTLACESEWQRRAPLRRGLRVLQTHGRQDPLLPFEHAQALHRLLVNAALVVDFQPFDGVHTIPMQALESLGNLIAGCVSGT